MIFNDFSGHSNYPDNIVINLQLVLSRGMQVYRSSCIDGCTELLQRGKKLIEAFNIDYQQLEERSSFLGESKLINIVFHCPFIKDELPGNFYMPKLRQSAVDRSQFIQF